MDRPLKIGIVCNPSIGGSGILATELAHRLSTQGHQLTVISNDTPFKYKQLNENLETRVAHPEHYPLFEHPDSILPLVGVIIAACKEKELDVIHAHYAIPNAMAAIIAKQILGDEAPPLVTTLHGTDALHLGERKNYKTLMEYALDHSEALTTVSEDLKNVTIRNFNPDNDIKVIYNFYHRQDATQSRSEIRESMGVGENECLILHLSNLREIKRIDLLLEVMTKIPKEVQVKLLILAGEDCTELEAQIEKLELQDRIIIREKISHVEDFLNACDMTAFTSEYESFCLGILEGLAFKKPAVAFRVGGIPEVLKEGKSGYMVPFGDTDAMAEKVILLATDKEQRESMGISGYSRWQSHFMEDVITEQYLDLYRSIIKN